MAALCFSFLIFSLSFISLLLMQKKNGNGIRGVSSYGPRLAVPATAVSSSSKGGFLSWLIGESPATKAPPLYETFPGLKLPPALPDTLVVAPTEITTLDNGLKVASENIPVRLNYLFSWFLLKIWCFHIRCIKYEFSYARCMCKRGCGILYHL
mgnify:CR=1 FL=1